VRGSSILLDFSCSQSTFSLRLSPLCTTFSLMALLCSQFSASLLPCTHSDDPRYKSSGKWQARLCSGRKQFHLGYFAREDDAARAYDRAVLMQVGTKAGWLGSGAGAVTAFGPWLGLCVHTTMSHAVLQAQYCAALTHCRVGLVA
jgi:hypothetical protein